MTREVAEAHGPIKLKVMADYGCFAIWDDEFPTGAIDPASLPLTPGLVDDLQQWADTFDSMLNWDDPHENHWTAEREQAFNAQGRMLTCRVAVELGSGYAVRYWRGAESHDARDFEL
ncbi:hypothetical protein D3C71_986880 [compost metagenome]